VRDVLIIALLTPEALTSPIIASHEFSAREPALSSDEDVVCRTNVVCASSGGEPSLEVVWP
jgi:hypothetical protein